MAKFFSTLFLLTTFMGTGWGSPAARLPMTFEENRGQAPPQVRFLSRGEGYTLLLSPSEARVALQNPGHSKPAEIRLRLLGANRQPRLFGVDPQPGRFNYFLGNDPSAWVTGAPAFGGVRYEQVYPGIDLVYYGNPRELEYDFIVSPGADPARIRMAFPGAKKIELNPEGDLLLQTSSGTVRLRKPLVYQKAGPERVEVAGGYRILRGRTVVFDLGEYDHARTLVIDPVFSYSTYLGACRFDYISDVAVDTQGHAYVAGTTASPNLPASGGAYQQAAPGGGDVFVAKLSADGTSFVYVTYLGGSRADDASGIAIDASGNAYITGLTNSTNFPTAGNTTQKTLAGSADAFIAKLNATGSALLYSGYHGGTLEDAGTSIAVDASGRAVISGYTRSANFPVLQPVQASLGGGYDAFVARFAADGALTSSTFLGGSGEDRAMDLALGPEGHIYLTGYTGSTAFPRTEGSFQTVYRGSVDAFVTRLSPNASTLVYSTYLGSTGVDRAYGIAVDAEGNAFVVGETAGANFPVKNALQPLLAGSTDVFISKLDPDGAALVYSTFFGGADGESGRGIALDTSGSAYITGVTASTSTFPITGALDGKRGGVDPFVARLDPWGSTLLFSTFLSGSHMETAARIAVDGEGNAYVAGLSESTDFVTTAAGIQPDFHGDGVSRYGGQSWVKVNQGLAHRNMRAVAADPKNSSVVYAGSYGGGVFKCTNAGGSWSQTALTLLQVLALAVDPVDSATVYAGTDGGMGIFKTTDGGASWNSMNLGLSPVPTITSIVIDPKKPSTLYATTHGSGVFRKTELLENWVAVNTGLVGEARKVFSLVVDPVNTSNLYIGTNGAVYRSTNSGVTWEITSLKNVGEVRALAIDPSSPSTLYAGLAAALPGMGTVSMIMKSTDAGANWATSKDPIYFPAFISSLCMDPKNSSVLYAGTLGEGVYKSANKGDNWQAINSGLDNRDVRQIAMSASDSNRVYAATNAGSDGFLTRLAPTSVFYFAQIGDGRDGPIQCQTTLIFVNTGGDTVLKMEFFDSSGQRMAVPLGGFGTDSTFVIPLSAGEAFSAQTPGQGSLQVGYARVTTSDAVGGTAVFTRTDPASGRILYEAGVPATPASLAFSVLLDSLDVKDTGLALVNAAPAGLRRPAPEAKLTLRLYDRTPNMLAEKTLRLAAGPHAGTHQAKFIHELFPELKEQASEMEGMVMVISDQPVAAVTLRQNDDPTKQFPAKVPTLTAFPVVPFNNLGNVFYFPQIGEGTVADIGLRTTLALTNMGAVPAPVKIEFFDRAGEPMQMKLASFAAGSTVQFALGPGQTLFEQTQPLGSELRLGYARVTTNLWVGGTAVFTRSHAPNGVILYEAGVPASRPLYEFSVFLDSLQHKETGLAFVNTSSLDALATFRLYDKQYGLIAERVVSLTPLQNVSKFIYEIFEGVPGVDEMEGVVTVESTEPLAAVTVRQNDNPLLSFPQDVPTLAAFPVIPGRVN
jgi:photosystem II stability/assembly factor-like uncharacterized protein